MSDVQHHEALKSSDLPANNSPDATGSLPEFSRDQLTTLRAIEAAARVQDNLGAAKHLAPLEITMTEAPNRTMHVEEKRDGKIVETDDVYADGTKVQHKIDKKGNATETQTDKTGKLVYSETKDAQGHKVSSAERRKDTVVTHDGKGNVVSTAKDLPNGGKLVDTTDAHGNKVSAEYDKQGHLNTKTIETTDSHGNKISTQYDKQGHKSGSMTRDSAGHLIQDEYVVREAATNTAVSHITNFDKEGNRVSTEDRGPQGRTVTTWDKSGNETRNGYNPKGRLSSIKKTDSSGHIVEDEYIGADGSKSFTHYDSQNRPTSVDEVDAHGVRTSHRAFDNQGRETDNVSYENGKTWDETKTVWNDKTGQHTETHSVADGSVDIIEVVNADGSRTGGYLKR